MVARLEFIFRQYSLLCQSSWTILKKHGSELSLYVHLTNCLDVLASVGHTMETACNLQTLCDHTWHQDPSSRFISSSPSPLVHTTPSPRPPRCDSDTPSTLPPQAFGLAPPSDNLPRYPHTFLTLLRFLLKCPFYFLNFLFILFVSGCVGSSLLRAGCSLAAESVGYSSLRCAGFSLRWLLLLWSTGSRCVGFSSCGARA